MASSRPTRVVLVVLTAAVLLAAQCPWEAKTTPVKAVAKAGLIPDSADQVIFGLTSIMHDRGINKGELLSDTAYVYDDGSRMELRGVQVTFYTAMGEKDGLLTSRAGRYNSRLSRLEASGDVVVVREDGKRLTSPHLVYDQLRNQILTDSSFVLTEPSRQLSGIGLESDPQLTNFRCIRACKGVTPVALPAQ